MNRRIRLGHQDTPPRPPEPRIEARTFVQYMEEFISYVRNPFVGANLNIALKEFKFRHERDLVRPEHRTTEEWRRLLDNDRPVPDNTHDPAYHGG